jgi:hypothetical protein
MRGRGKSSGGVSSGKTALKETPKEKPKKKPQQSSDDSDESDTQQNLNKRKDLPASREISCADAAREEVESLLSEPEPKRPA